MLLELKVIIATLVFLPIMVIKFSYDFLCELAKLPNELYEQIKLTAILVELQKNKDKQ